MVVGPMIDSYKYNGPKLKPASFNSRTTTIKFLCSYGGKILPRYPDGKLRYHGGETRVLAVERSISFSKLAGKLGGMCGATMNLKCQLPTEDMDALVSITSDEDLANLIEEYDRAATYSTVSSAACLKVRAFLSPPKPTTSQKTSSLASSCLSSSSSSSSTTSTNGGVASPKSSITPTHWAVMGPPRRSNCILHIMCRPANMAASPHKYGPAAAAAAAKGLPRYGPAGKASNHFYLIHHGNQWQ